VENFCLLQTFEEYNFDSGLFFSKKRKHCSPAFHGTVFRAFDVKDKRKKGPRIRREVRKVLKGKTLYT